MSIRSFIVVLTIVGLPMQSVFGEALAKECNKQVDFFERGYARRLSVKETLRQAFDSESHFIIVAESHSSIAADFFTTLIDDLSTKSEPCLFVEMYGDSYARTPSECLSSCEAGSPEADGRCHDGHFWDETKCKIPIAPQGYAIRRAFDVGLKTFPSEPAGTCPWEKDLARHLNCRDRAASDFIASKIDDGTCKTGVIFYGYGHITPDLPHRKVLPINLAERGIRPFRLALLEASVIPEKWSQNGFRNAEIDDRWIWQKNGKPICRKVTGNLADNFGFILDKKHTERLPKMTIRDDGHFYGSWAEMDGFVAIGCPESISATGCETEDLAAKFSKPPKVVNWQALK